MIYLLPIIGALIGWITNFIAVKMLFYPREEVRFAGMKVQGVFPKRQSEIARRIGKMVVDELFNMDDLRKHIAGPEVVGYSIKKIGDTVEDFLEVKFPEKHPIINMLMGKKRKRELKNELIQESEEKVPQIIDHIVENIDNVLDIEQIVVEKVSALSPERLEQLMHQIIKKELRFIEIIGAILGFLIGLIQVLMISIGA